MKEKGKGTRSIAKILAISRSTVTQTLKRGTSTRPAIVRPRTLDAHLHEIKKLYGECEGSVVRVGEELEKKIGAPVPYSTLTKFCRDHGLGAPLSDKQPAGHYHFGPGVEMQHDTSPIEVRVGGVERLYQAAALKFCFCRCRYLRFYRRFTRFHCQDFLTRGFEFFECLCGRCMIDNSSVIVAQGTGASAVMAPEMQAFEKWFGFRFAAHEKGDANRSAKVERDFDFIQRNFLKGRTFADDADLNRQAEKWARDKNARYNKKLRLCPQTLLAEEKAHALRLPEYRRPVYRLHVRRVDAYGYVHLDGNEYSAPNEVLGSEITLRETMEAVILLDGHRELCAHTRAPEGERSRSTLHGHGRAPRRRHIRGKPQQEETWLAVRSKVLGRYVAGLRRRVGRSFPLQVRKLYGLCQEYDRAHVERMAERAMGYGLYDTSRLEAMLLQEFGATLFGFRPRRGSDDPSGCVTPVAAPPCDSGAAQDAKTEDPSSLEAAASGGDPDADA